MHQPTSDNQIRTIHCDAHIWQLHCRSPFIKGREHGACRPPDRAGSIINTKTNEHRRSRLRYLLQGSRREGGVWTIRDDAGFPTSTNQSNEAAMPFWSSETRARLTIETVASYRNFTPHQLTLEVFRDRWLVGLENDALRVGINWSGERATGFDVAPADARRRLASGS